MIWRLALLLLAGLAAIAAVWLSPADAAILGLSRNDFSRAVAAFLAAAAILAYFYTPRSATQPPVKGRKRKRNAFAEAVSLATAWMIVFSIAFLSFTYRFEVMAIVERVAADLMPGMVTDGPAGEAIVGKRQNGHFVVDARVNGARAQFLFDTGASSMVIRAEDAGKLGIDFGTLNFAIPVSTANGAAMAAETMLDRVSVGKIVVKNVRALVAKPGALSENLLGMSFLEKLASYTVESNKLI